jgi:outer membrane protein OmpA-like peptidoglycan-associated protein
MRYILLLILTIECFNLAAQPPKEYSIRDKKAIKRYEEALARYQEFQLEEARLILLELTQKHKDFIESFFMLAQIYDDQGKTHEAIEPLEHAMNLNPNYYPAGWMMLAECYLYKGDYKNAERAITPFIPVKKESRYQEKRAQLILSSCTYAQKAMNRPVPFAPVNLGPGVNTAMNEYYPCITADEKTLLFTRLLPAETRAGKQEDFFVAEWIHNKWSEASPLKEINTLSNEGAPSLSADGSMLIFTACESADGSWGGDRQGIGSCDLFYSTRTANGWGPATNMGNSINSNTWESQPSFSANGRTLYFVRGKRTAGGIKEQDIFFSYLDEKNHWSVPVKVPGRINTEFEEESVMIHPDGNTLYFSSNGHSGMGGLDIFYSKMQADGSWGAPVNLGYPINTYADENSLQVTADGTHALFASEREGGYGGLDLYRFELYPEARPGEVTYLTGVISDKLSFKLLEAHIDLIDLATGKRVIEAYSRNGTGDYLVCLPAGKDYALLIEKEGYLPHSENFSLTHGTRSEPYRIDVSLQKLRAGATIVLKNVFFDSGKSELKPESQIELNKLVELLKENPEKSIEIGGHTDDVGSDANNLALSQKRSEAVVAYLVSKGIDTTRLSAKGYGEASPIGSNTTEEGRALNRRTEFKIMK